MVFLVCTGYDSRRRGGRFRRRDLIFWGDTRAVPFKIIISAIHNSQMKGWCIGFITARLPRTWYFSRPHGGKFDRRDLTWKGPLVQSHHWRSPFGYAIMPIQDQNSGLLVVRVSPALRSPALRWQNRHHMHLCDLLCPWAPYALRDFELYFIVSIRWFQTACTWKTLTRGNPEVSACESRSLSQHTYALWITNWFLGLPHMHSSFSDVHLFCFSFCYLYCNEFNFSFCYAFQCVKFIHNKRFGSILFINHV